jgi:phage repressor protein C with HTH and peptisase S24 domain
MTTVNPESTLAGVPEEDVYLRFAEALEAIGLPQSRLAKEAGISEGQVSRGVRHRTGLDLHWRRIAEVLKPYGIDDRWLLFGQGEMRPATQAPGGGAVSSATPREEFPALTLTTQTEGVREVGVVTELASYSEPVSPRTKSLPGETAVLVQDGSMDPLIRPGQWVLLAPQARQAKDGELVLVRTTAGDAYVRRYRIEGERVVLEHLNQDRRFRTVVLAKSDIASALVVVGVVFE